MQQYPWLGFKVKAVCCLKGMGCFEGERHSPCLPGLLRLLSPWPHLLELGIASALQAHSKEVGTLVQSKASTV